MRSVMMGIICIVLTNPAWAVSKCVTPDGKTTFTDGPCPEAANREEVDIKNSFSPGSGLREGEREMLNRIRRREQRDHYERRYEDEREQRYQLSYDDRLRIRELEMKKRELQKSLGRGSKDWSQNLAISDQIHDLDRQIEQIRAPKW